MEKSKVGIKFLDETIAQQYGQETPGSAGYDIRAVITRPVHLNPGVTQMFGTGIALDMAGTDLAAFLLPRSGAGCRGLVLANGVGLIDSDYQQEIKVVLWNRTPDQRFTIEPYQRVAQMVFMKVEHPRFNIVQQFAQETGRGGFGSTGDV